MECQEIVGSEVKLMIVVREKDATSGGELAIVKIQDGRPSNGNLVISLGMVMEV